MSMRTRCLVVYQSIRDNLEVRLCFDVLKSHAAILRDCGGGNTRDLCAAGDIDHNTVRRNVGQLIAQQRADRRRQGFEVLDIDWLFIQLNGSIRVERQQVFLSILLEKFNLLPNNPKVNSQTIEN